jgi:chitin deacetylase
VAAPPPKPIPKPDPLLKFRQAQQVPAALKGHVFHHVPVKPGDKPFALTFDDGPWPEYTGQILQILAEHNAKATFFMVGQMVREHPKIARQVRDAGHAIGNHSWSHPSRPRDPVAQIERTNAEIKKAVGFTPSTFRPPYGILKNGMAKQAMKDGQAVLIWSADSNDWKKPAPETIARRIINEATPGGIALMHDGGGTRRNTVAALPIILETLEARGYYFVTVPELLRLRYVAPPKPKTKPKAKTKAKTKTKAKAKPIKS